MDCVLADRHAVAMVQLPLLDRLAVHERTVRAAQIDEPELLASPLEPGVVAARGRITQDDVVVGRAPEAQRVVARAVAVPRVGP